ELIVVRLHLGIRHGPVLDGAAFRDHLRTVASNGLSSDLEVPGRVPPGPAGPVKSGSAYTLTPREWAVPARRSCDFRVGAAIRKGSAGEILEQLQPAVPLELIVHLGQREVCRTAIASPLQSDHFEPGLRELFADDATCPADANDNDVRWLLGDSHDV